MATILGKQEPQNALLGGLWDLVKERQEDDGADTLLQKHQKIRNKENICKGFNITSTTPSLVFTMASHIRIGYGKNGRQEENGVDTLQKQARTRSKECRCKEFKLI